MIMSRLISLECQEWVQQNQKLVVLLLRSLLVLLVHNQTGELTYTQSHTILVLEKMTMILAKTLLLMDTMSVSHRKSKYKIFLKNHSIHQFLRIKTNVLIPIFHLIKGHGKALKISLKLSAQKELNKSNQRTNQNNDKKKDAKAKSL